MRPVRRFCQHKHSKGRSPMAGGTWWAPCPGPAHQVSPGPSPQWLQLETPRSLASSKIPFSILSHSTSQREVLWKIQPNPSVINDKWGFRNNIVQPVYNDVKFNSYMRDIAIHGSVSKSLFYCDSRDRAFSDHAKKHNSEANKRIHYLPEETTVHSC